MNSTIKNGSLMSVEAATELINKGNKLVINGEEELLDQLPKGNWVGGTIPYFYLKGEKGRMEKSLVFVSDFSDLTDNVNIKTAPEEELSSICNNGFENGFHFLILPFSQNILSSFALNSPNYENLYTNPLIGLIAGVDLDELASGKVSKTYNGSTGESYTDSGVVMYCELPAEKVARLEIVNVFEPSDKIEIQVAENQFVVKECLINGENKNLYQYIKETDLDISYPLVCNYGGATVNISFQRLDDENEEVIFYAPLFKGEKYTTSKRHGSYVEAFESKVNESMNKEKNVVFHCNCILNYVYGELNEHSIGFSGPTTFGEIAYNLLNQTFSYLAIDEL